MLFCGGMFPCLDLHELGDLLVFLLFYIDCSLPADI